MAYAFDPDLAEGIPMLPRVDLADPVSARAMVKDLLVALPEPDTTAVDVRELEVPGPEGAPDVPLRVYTPQTATAPVPGVYDIHGGGFVLGTLDLVHGRNAELCRELNAVVVSVDYRLAPEQQFPAGLEDCYAGLVWMSAHARELGVDPDRIAVHGTSAGGGLAAAVALLCRDRGGPRLCFQYLAVPEVDDRLATPSMRMFRDTPLWNRPYAVISWDSYLGSGRRGTDGVSPYAAPMRAADLSGLPPAYVNAMEFDPLRDESIAYALALLKAGVQVELHLFPGTSHGSALLASAHASQREAAEEIVVLRRALGA
jgi:acetyl esterase